MPPSVVKYMKQILVISFVANLLVFVLLSVGPFSVTEGQMRLYGGFFLMIFVCTHGWYRYGLNRIVLFFCMAVVVTWSLETLSIAVGFPFGHFAYTDKLGEKIGVVPVMIFPAYFFTGYLAWTTAGIFFNSRGTGIRKKHLVLQPLAAAFLMLTWNLSFDPIMSTLHGCWIWESGGAYFGVPLTNFGGWLLTTFLFFQLFAWLVTRTVADETLEIDRAYWQLIPLMYAVQGLPSFLYAFSSRQGQDIYRPVAVITAAFMFLPAVLSLIRLRTHDSRQMSR